MNERIRHTVLYLLVQILIVTVFSCKERTEEKKLSKYEIKREQQKSLDAKNEDEANSLISKYKAIRSEESNYKFTYEIQELISDTTNYFSLQCTVIDIFKRDNDFVLKIVDSFSDKTCIFEIVTTGEFLRKLESIKNEDSSLKACLIFKPKCIKSVSSLTIGSGDYCDDNSEDILTLEFNEAVSLIQGNLVDFYLFEILAD